MMQSVHDAAPISAESVGGPPAPDLFVREDVAKPENRVNLASRFIHNGRNRIYHLFATRAVSSRRRAYRRRGLSLDESREIETNDENALLADIEADRALLEAVVKRWDGQVDRTLRRDHGSAWVYFRAWGLPVSVARQH